MSGAQHEPVSTDWLETITGCRFNPQDTSPSFNLTDLIYGVARESRYNGQYREDVEFYSVAEHLVLMTRHVIAKGRPDGETFSAKDLRTLALHDGQEGLFKDIVRPMKRGMPEYRAMEDSFCKNVLAPRYDLHWPLPAWIKELDNRILVDERAQAMNPSNNHWGSIEDLEPLGVKLQFWSPSRAALEYKHLLADLGVRN